MTAMAKRLLIGVSIVAILGLSGPASAQPVREQPRAFGISAYVMTVLDMFCGGVRGAMISLFARGEVETVKKKPIRGNRDVEVMRLIP